MKRDTKVNRKPEPGQQWSRAPKESRLRDLLVRSDEPDAAAARGIEWATAMTTDTSISSKVRWRWVVILWVLQAFADGYARGRGTHRAVRRYA